MTFQTCSRNVKGCLSKKKYKKTINKMNTTTNNPKRLNSSACKYPHNALYFPFLVWTNGPQMSPINNSKLPSAKMFILE